MHEAAFRWVQKIAAMLPQRKAVCELGSRNVNGSVRSLFASAPCYVGIDTHSGPGVDIVADASNWRPEDKTLFDTVISTECLEHAPRGDLICQTAFEILDRGGVFIITAAGIMRMPHSAIDGKELRPGEWYANITERELRQWLSPFKVSLIDSFSTPGDIYAFAVKV